MLYNPKVKASDETAAVHPLLGYEIDIDNIQVKKKNPLKDIDENLANYTKLVHIFEEFRKYDVDLSRRLLAKIQKNNTFSGNDLYLIKKTFDMFSKLNSKMREFGDTYQFRQSTMHKSFVAPKQKLPMIKAHLIWLTSNLMVIDHIQDVHKILYLEDGSLRRIIKNSIGDKKIDAEGERKLKELTLQINHAVSVAESEKFREQIILVRSISEELEQTLEYELNAKLLLKEIMINTTSMEIAQGRKDFRISAFGIEDYFMNFLGKITNALSGFFGNIAGSVKWRKGFLFDSEPATEIATNALVPMDIILEKSPFVLTDKFIPGHYGHVALYLGTKKQLEELGMWNHPDIIPYQEQIENGYTILESVRSGVRLNTIKDFMNIDEFTIVRKLNGLESTAQVSEQITRGMDQMGKSYDFNFDISTLDKIVCSELVYIVFGHVNWPTRYRVGRATVTPDDIAEVLFQKGTPFKVANYMLSTERHTIEMMGIDYLANIFDYEKRTSDGEEIKDPKDPTNSFWKKETKCYTLTSSTPSGDKEGSEAPVKTCKTTYKEYTYEEVGNQINN